MITTTATCDICGKPIGSRGGAYVDLNKHNLTQIVLSTYPPQYPGRFDLCDECRNALSAWLNERKREASQ